MSLIISSACSNVFFGNIYYSYVESPFSFISAARKIRYFSYFLTHTPSGALTLSVCRCCLVTQPCLTLPPPHTNCSPPDASVHGIFQARILAWVAISFSRGSSGPRDWTCVSCLAGRFFLPLSHLGSTPPPTATSLIYILVIIFLIVL